MRDLAPFGPADRPTLLQGEAPARAVRDLTASLEPVEMRPALPPDARDVSWLFRGPKGALERGLEELAAWERNTPPVRGTL